MELIFCFQLFLLDLDPGKWYGGFFRYATLETTEALSRAFLWGWLELNCPKTLQPLVEELLWLMGKQFCGKSQSRGGRGISKSRSLLIKDCLCLEGWGSSTGSGARRRDGPRTETYIWCNRCHPLTSHTGSTTGNDCKAPLPPGSVDHCVVR